MHKHFAMDVRRQVLASKIDKLCDDFLTKCDKEKKALKNRNLARHVLELHGASSDQLHRYCVYLSIKLMIKTRQIIRECDKDKTKIKTELLKLIVRARVLNNMSN